MIPHIIFREMILGRSVIVRDTRVIIGPSSYFIETSEVLVAHASCHGGNMIDIRHGYLLTTSAKEKASNEPSTIVDIVSEDDMTLMRHSRPTRSRSKLTGRVPLHELLWVVM